VGELRRRGREGVVGVERDDDARAAGAFFWFFGFLGFLFRSIGLLSFDLIFDRSRLSFSVRFHRFHRPRSKLTRRPPRSARPQLTMRQAELEMAMEDAEERAAVQRGRAKASGAPARGESSPPSVLTL
jgi:hypothetical protein